jgi:hypothetical protein
MIDGDDDDDDDDSDDDGAGTTFEHRIGMETDFVATLLICFLK